MATQAKKLDRVKREGISSMQINDLALKLAMAVCRWRKVDSYVADVGWTRENEGEWDDCRAMMSDLADEVLSMFGKTFDDVVADWNSDG